MASGDLTASVATLCSTAAEIKTAVDLLNLTAATDFIMVTPVSNGQTLVYKIERAA